jgi:hypothetical protein
MRLAYPQAIKKSIFVYRWRAYFRTGLADPRRNCCITYQTHCIRTEYPGPEPSNHLPSDELRVAPQYLADSDSRGGPAIYAPPDLLMRRALRRSSRANSLQVRHRSHVAHGMLVSETGDHLIDSAVRMLLPKRLHSPIARLLADATVNG